MFNTLKIFIRDAMQSIKRNSVMSIASVLSVVCALIIIGVILALAINVNYITSQIEDSLEIKVYLKDTIPDLTRESVYSALISNDKVALVEYESKAQALEKFRESLKGNDYLLSGISSDSSPLPASFIVTAKDADSMQDVYLFSLTLDGVMEVVYNQDTIDKLLQFNKLINAISLCVLAILSVIAVFIIFNTIKLTVFSRRNEISIMKYVGATDGYIRFPFLIEGALLGLTGALISMLIIRNLYYFLAGMLSGSVSLISLGGAIASPSYVIGKICICYALYGIVLGSIGSMFSLKKFLRV